MEGQPAQTPAAPPQAGEMVAPLEASRLLRPARRSRRRRAVILVALIGVVTVTGAALLYQRYAAWESTDDAQIDGYIFPVSSRVPGYVTRVLVDNNQNVEAGTVLAQLDPKDYEVAVATAKAALANDQATAASLQINVPITS